jgi:hypothetical protein
MLHGPGERSGNSAGTSDRNLSLAHRMRLLRVMQQFTSEAIPDTFRLIAAQHSRHNREETLRMTDDPSSLPARTRFRVAMILAIAVDALQILVFPLFSEGALSPADDILDLAVGAALVRLLGWHWEFLPTFFAELLPGVDFVPFWTLAVANVHRKWKQREIRTPLISE